MTRNFAASASLSGVLPAMALAILAGGLFEPEQARAQVVERGVEGGVIGALIGGLVGGGRGAGTGAAIGAGVGIVSGAAEADANARARAAYESDYYGAPPRPGGPSLIHDIQASLARRGYDPGPVDGVYGQQTADAISQYQYANRLPVDGRASPQLLNFMISQGG
jgi:uncharacterized protein YcfJ